MNMNKFLFASMILAGMTACSKEDIASENNESGSEMEGAAYMSLSIAMPSAKTSRAGSPDMNEGTTEEQKISNLAIYIWSKDETKLTVKLIDGKDLRPNQPNNPNATDKSTVYTTDAIAVDKGAHKIAVIANGNNYAGIQAINSPSQLRKVYTITPEIISSISKGENFLMTNANTATSQDKTGKQLTVSTAEKENGKFYEDGTVAVNVQGTKAHPTAVVIPIERTVAKIEDKTNSYTFDVKNTPENKKDQVIFKKMTLVNANTKFFLVKNIRPMLDGNDATTEDFRPNEQNYYVVDPNFEKQDKNTIKDFIYNRFQWSAADNTALDVFSWKTLNSNNRPCFYSLENTMTAEEQKNAYTTGLYYQAVYKVNGKEEGKNVYKYKGIIYTFDQLQTLTDIQLNDLTDESTADKFNAIGVTKYEKGVCYYPYWIRHIDSNEKLAPMEFGVVRNNYYQMTINSVAGIGTPNPENPDPDTPDENPDTMLEVLVKVMPWTVRNNNIDF